MDSYVVTFNHRSNDTAGLRRMTLADARALAEYAERWTLRHSRVLNATTGELVS